jgi:Ca-activated chloride channel homolog
MSRSLLLFSALLLNAQKPDLRVDVDLVTVACSVTDHGAPARDLKRGDFLLKDNGEPREISNFWQESDLPLTVALVADVSGSQMSFIRNHRDAIAQFLQQVIGERDRAMIVEIAGEARLDVPLTGSLSRLEAAVGRIGRQQGELLGPPCRNEHFPRSCGGTALWHGLYYTAEILKPVSGRKAIVVLSDGMDTGSDISLTDLIEKVQSAETVVYSIKYANPMRFLSLSATIMQAAARGLEKLSRESGGVNYPNPGKKTGEVFAEIESDLRNLYVLGFTPPADARDGAFHKLDVKTTRKDLVVRYRSGYWSATR